MTPMKRKSEWTMKPGMGFSVLFAPVHRKPSYSFHIVLPLYNNDFNTPYANARCIFI